VQRLAADLPVLTTTRRPVAASEDDLGRQGLVHTRMLGLTVHVKESVPEPPAAIGDVAVRFRLPPHVLRRLESVGLLTPARDSCGHRRYGPAEPARIAMILMGKEAGFGLGELHALACPLPFDECPHAREQIDARIPAEPA
jgi:MerR family copper efflux transcriptional regulator